MCRLRFNGDRAGARTIVLAALGCVILFAPGFAARGSPFTNVHTVFLIVMENKDWDAIRGNSDCPYINDTLLPIASRAEQYFTPNDLHPSEPNYLWLEAGTNFGILTDDDPVKNRIHSTNHLVTLLESAGISWKTYQESYQPEESPLTDHKPYVAHHNPFVFFDDVANNPTRLTNHVRPYSELASDLRNHTVARYNFIVPNVFNDMHSLGPGSNSKEKQGDDWLHRELPVIFSSDAYTNNGAVFIVWDEGHTKNSPIGMFVISPLAKGGGYASQVSYTHSSLLRTLQEIFGVEPFLGDAANAASLSDLFLLESSTAAAEGLKLSLSSNPADGSAEFTLNGVVSGATNVIQASSNLVDWVPVSTQRTANASLPFAALSRSNDRPRFFRAVEFR